MVTDPYSADDFFESENDQAFLKNQPKELDSNVDYKRLEPLNDDPLTVSALDPKTETAEERVSREKARERRRTDIDDTEFIRKEIEEAKKELAKQKYDYSKISPRLLRSYAARYQELALVGKAEGFRSESNSDILLMPIIENDGEHDIVVLRSPVIGSLERHQLFPNSDTVKMLRDFFAEQDS